MLLPACGLWGLIALGMYIFTLGFVYFPAKASENGTKDIQLEAYYHLRKLGFRFYDTQQTGKVMALFTSDTPKAVQGFGVFAGDYPINIILLIVTAHDYDVRELAIMSFRPVYFLRKCFGAYLLRKASPPSG